GMDAKSAGFISQVFKFQELQGYAGRTSFHLEGSCDPLIGFEFVNGAVESELTAPGVGGLEFKAAVTLVVQFQYLRSHPLLQDPRLDVRPEHKLHGQVEVSCYE